MKKNIIIINFNSGIQYCKLIKDTNNKKLIVKGFYKKIIYENNIKKEFPDSVNGLKQAFHYYKETFNNLFVNELIKNENYYSDFINSLNINEVFEFYNEI